MYTDSSSCLLIKYTKVQEKYYKIVYFSERDVAYNLFQALDQGHGYTAPFKKKTRPYTANGGATFKPAPPKRYQRPVTAGIRTSYPQYGSNYNPQEDEQYLNIVAKSLGRLVIICKAILSLMLAIRHQMNTKVRIIKICQIQQSHFFWEKPNRFVIYLSSIFNGTIPTIQKPQTVLSSQDETPH